MNIKDIIKPDHRVVVQLSGGKDSLAALHKMLPWKDQITVHYCDTGDSFPHIVRHVTKQCDRWGVKLDIIKPDIDVHKYIQLYGVPSDIVPIWDSPQLRHVMPSRKSYPIQSAADCCNAMLWQPLHLAAMILAPDLVIRGTKGTDAHISVSEYFKDTASGLTFFSPVWNMTDDDIYEYLKSNDVTLPFQYAKGINHSLDCMRCSGWGNTEAECQRIKFTKTYYPEVMPELKARSRIICDAVMSSMAELEQFHASIQE